MCVDRKTVCSACKTLSKCSRSEMLGGGYWDRLVSPGLRFRESHQIGNWAPLPYVERDISFFFLNVDGCFAWMCVYAECSCSALRIQKRATGFLKLESQTVVSCCRDARNQTRVPSENNQFLLPLSHISSPPQILSFFWDPLYSIHHTLGLV